MGGDPNKRLAILLELIPDPVRVQHPKAPDVLPASGNITIEDGDAQHVGIPLEIHGDLTVPDTGIGLQYHDIDEDTLRIAAPRVRIESQQVRVHNIQAVTTLPTVGTIPVGAVVAVDGGGFARHCFSEGAYRLNQPVGVCLVNRVGTIDVVTQGTLEIEGARYVPGEPVYVGEDGFLSQTAPMVSGSYIAQVGIAISETMVVLNLPVTFIARNS